MSAHRNSAWTGRAPRSMEQAFGVRSNRDPIHPMQTPPEPRRRLVEDRALYAVAIMALVLLALIAGGYFGPAHS